MAKIHLFTPSPKHRNTNFPILLVRNPHLWWFKCPPASYSIWQYCQQDLESKFWLEEVISGSGVQKFQSLVTLPVCSVCFLLAVQDVSSQLSQLLCLHSTIINPNPNKHFLLLPSITCLGHRALSQQQKSNQHTVFAVIINIDNSMVFMD